MYWSEMSTTACPPHRVFLAESFFTPIVTNPFMRITPGAAKNLKNASAGQKCRPPHPRFL